MRTKLSVVSSLLFLTPLLGACSSASSDSTDESGRTTVDDRPQGTAASSNHLPAITGDTSGTGGSSYGGPAASGTGGGNWPDEAGDNTTENYEGVGTNPFVLTGHDPLSTFGADVDTASYDIFRRDVLAGALPNPLGVRLEEYVNFFDYSYDAPEADAEHPFSITLDASPSLVSRNTDLVRIGIQAELPPPEEKKPANLVFLIDISGSMSGELPLVKYTLLEALDVLDPSDTLSIVTYAGSTRVVLEPTPISQKSAIEEALNALESGGGTNGAAGIELAYEQAEAGFIEGGINHVLLCTDGDFNVGLSSTEALVELIEEKRETGITLTALGYGTGNYNDAMMEAISNKGNGVYGAIFDEDQAELYVHERLLSSMHLVAKDLKIQVEFNPNEVYAYRLLGYENRAIADNDFRNDIIDAGEIGAGHRVTALYEIVRTEDDLPMIEGAPPVETGDAFDGTAEIDPGDVVLVKVRYKDVDASAEDPAYEIAQSLSPEAVAAGHADSSSDLQWASAIAAFAEILKQSPYADPGALDAIQVIVDEQQDSDPERNEFASLFAAARSLIEQ